MKSILSRVGISAIYHTIPLQLSRNKQIVLKKVYIPKKSNLLISQAKLQNHLNSEIVVLP